MQFRLILVHQGLVGGGGGQGRLWIGMTPLRLMSRERKNVARTAMNCLA